MSWDSFERFEKCPCGKGTYKIIDSSNDWGQTTTAWHMECGFCKSAYSLHSFDYYSSGLRSEGHVWVLSGPYKQAKQLEHEANDLKQRALAVAKKKHLESLLSRLDGLSKKQVWAEIHAAVPHYKSLGTFYLHTKGMDIREIVAGLFTDFALDGIWKLLGVQDKEVTRLQKSADSLQKKAEALIRRNSAR